MHLCVAVLTFIASMNGLALREREAAIEIENRWCTRALHPRQ